MCPCNPDNGEFVYALLVAAAVLVGVSLMRKHWSKMGPGFRTGGILGLIVLVGLLGYTVVPTSPDSSPDSGAFAIETGGLPTLVDLGAGKCVPCKMMAPILEELKDEYAGRMNVRFIDVWENRDEAAPFRVRTIPTQIFYDASGRELYRHEGFCSKEDILAKWQELGIALTATGTPMPVLSAPTRSRASFNADASTEAPVSPESDSSELTDAQQPDVVEPDLTSDLEAQVVAYYFHRTMRCYSCRTIEELSKEVVEQNFSGELASGLLEFRAVNTDEPENSHFEDDYKLSVQSLVLVRVENGEVTEWKNLEKVWDLFEDYGAFAEYVQGEVTRYLYPDDMPAEAGTSET